MVEVMKSFVPHSELTPGLWYLRTDYEPFHTVVSILRYMIGPRKGELGVWMIDEEGSHEVAAFAEDQFIGPVPPPIKLTI